MPASRQGARGSASADPREASRASPADPHVPPRPKRMPRPTSGPREDEAGTGHSSRVTSETGAAAGSARTRSSPRGGASSTAMAASSATSRRTIPSGSTPADLCFEPDLQRRQDDFELWRRLLGWRQWQGQHEGLSSGQASEIAIFLTNLPEAERGTFLANLAAMLAEVMVDVTTLAANLIPADYHSDESSAGPLPLRDAPPGGDMVEVEVAPDESRLAIEDDGTADAGSEVSDDRSLHDGRFPEEGASDFEEDEEETDSRGADVSREEEPSDRGDDEHEEVRLMQHSLQVITQFSLQLQALLQSLNSMTGREAHEKSSALLRRLQQRWPRSGPGQRPDGVDELEAGLVAFHLQDVNPSTQWSLSTNWANAWWEVFHALLGGDSEPSEEEHQESLAGPQVEPETQETDGEDEEVTQLFEELDGMHAASASSAKVVPTAAASYRVWEDWAVASEMGKASQGMVIPPRLRVVSATVANDASGPGEVQLTVGLSPRPPKLWRPRPDVVPDDPPRLWDLWRCGDVTDKDVVSKLGEKTLKEWMHQIDVCWGRRRRSMVREHDEDKGFSESLLKALDTDLDPMDPPRAVTVNQTHDGEVVLPNKEECEDLVAQSVPSTGETTDTCSLTPTTRPLKAPRNA